jgi:hypothetical protein
MPKPKPEPKRDGRPPHQPTEVDRETVAAMVAGGIAQEDIARCRGICENTLRKYYAAELDCGAAALNTKVILAHIKRIEAGEFAAIKWWQQSRMGWSERIVVDDGRLADTPMRVIVELVGEAPAPRIENQTTRPALPDAIRRNVQLVG